MDHTAHGAERPLRAAGTAFGSMRRGRGLYGPVIMPFEYFEDICVQAHAQNTHARGTRRHTARERGEDIRRSPYVSSTTLKRGRGAISTSVHIGLAQDARPRIPHPHRPAIDATCIASAPHFLSSAKLTHKEAQREVPPGRDCGTPMRGIARNGDATGQRSTPRRRCRGLWACLLRRQQRHTAPPLYPATADRHTSQETLNAAINGYSVNAFSTPPQRDSSVY